MLSRNTDKGQRVQGRDAGARSGYSFTDFAEKGQKNSARMAVAARALMRLRTLQGRTHRGWAPVRVANPTKCDRRIHSLIQRERHHDLGTQRVNEPLDLKDRPLTLWELQTDAILSQLVSKKLITVDELRRGIESLPREHQEGLSYYEKWAVSMSNILVEREVLSIDALEGRAGTTKEDARRSETRFAVGDFVRVAEESDRQPWPKPHLRTPGYIFGLVGEVVADCGEFSNPELLAYRRVGRKERLYRVRFRQRDLWEHYDETSKDTAVVEIYAPWLSPAPAPPEDQLSVQGVTRPKGERAEPCTHHHHDEKEEGNHPHSHGSRLETEQAAIDLEGSDRPAQRLAARLRYALEQTGIVTAAELRKGVEAVEMLGADNEGPKIAARAWTDPEFKQLLLSDASSAVSALGISGSNSTASTVLTVIENTPETHNLVVCTLCSCYPRAILGLSPAWYRSRSYRSRAIRDPRSLLQEFGTTFPSETRIEVHDSTADLRYMVLPMRPLGTEAWSEEQLATLVTRDSLIGVTTALSPKEA